MRELCSAICLIVLVAMVVPAIAQEPDPESEGSILLIMDASGSMGLEGPDGERPIDAAKAALLRLVEALPEGTSVGLRVYGHRVPNTDKANGCRDTELVVPVGPLDRGQMSEAILSFDARGFTPIGLSLEQAVEDLPLGGRRTVVLVSDGEDTCAPPDPCEIAQQIIADGFDLRVETLGFLVESGSVAERQLQCIANTTGGAYRTVGEIDLLAGVLSEVVGDAVGGPGVTPRILDGAILRTEAPALSMLAPTPIDENDSRTGIGSWRSLILPGETRWWKLELSDDEYMDVSAVLRRPVDLALGSGESFHLTLLNPEPEVVGFDRPGFGPTRAPVLDPGVSPEVWATMGNITDVTGLPPIPLVAGTHFIGLTWDGIEGTALAEVEFMVEVLAAGDRNEPWTEGLQGSEFLGFIGGGITEAQAPLIAVPPYDGPPQDENATLVTGTGTIETLIGQGETLWYAVELSGGEGLTVTITGLFGNPQTTAATGELGIRIIDPNGGLVGQLRPRTDLDRIDLDVVEPDFVLGSTSHDGTSRPIDGRHLVAVEWSAAPGPAELVFRMDFDRVIDPNATYPDNTAVDPSAGEELPEEPNGGGTSPILFVVIGAILVSAVAALGLKRRRRTTRGDTGRE